MYIVYWASFFRAMPQYLTNSHNLFGSPLCGHQERKRADFQDEITKTIWVVGTASWSEKQERFETTFPRHLELCNGNPQIECHPLFLFHSEGIQLGILGNKICFTLGPK